MKEKFNKKFELSDRQREELNSLCGTREEAERLIPFLAAAYETEQVFQWNHQYAEAPGASNDRINSMLDHLREVDRFIDELGPYEFLLDQQYDLANRRYTANPDELEIWRLHSYLRDDRSGFSIILERMIRTVEAYQQEHIPQGGKGKRVNRNYNNTLEYLAAGFEEVFPSHRVSRSKNSKFFPICRWFLVNFTDWRGTYQTKNKADPSETINKLIAWRKTLPAGRKVQVVSK